MIEIRSPNKRGDPSFGMGKVECDVCDETFGEVEMGAVGATAVDGNVSEVGAWDELFVVLEGGIL